MQFRRQLKAPLYESALPNVCFLFLGILHIFTYLLTYLFT